jgi:hypothetical protein
LIEGETGNRASRRRHHPKADDEKSNLQSLMGRDIVGRDQRRRKLQITFPSPGVPSAGVSLFAAHRFMRP